MPVSIAKKEFVLDSSSGEGEYRLLHSSWPARATVAEPSSLLSTVAGVGGFRAEEGYLISRNTSIT